MRKLNERGAVAAEFALLLPVLLTILFGIIEFGMIMYGREVVTNATPRRGEGGDCSGASQTDRGRNHHNRRQLSDRHRRQSRECDLHRRQAAGLTNPDTLTVTCDLSL